MRTRGLGRHLPLAITVVLLLLLAVLATLQYRWIGEVSDVHQQRLRAQLLATGTRFAQDFNHEVTRAFLLFHPDPMDAPDASLSNVMRQRDRWLAEAPYPDLVREIYHVAPGQEPGRLNLRVLRSGASAFEPCPWPADLEKIRERLLAIERAQEPWPALPSVSDLPGLVIPVLFSLPAPGEAGDPPSGHLILRMDSQVIEGEILPELTRRHFGIGPEAEYAVAVVDGRDPGKVIFRSDPSLPAESFQSADVRVPMFGLRHHEDLRRVRLQHGRHGPGRPRDRFMARIFTLRPGLGGPGDGWQLLVRHRDGSLEEAVALFRWHNLAVSAGILVLVASTSVLMVMATQRAQRLARQQIEFVAGVTHELNTPLTAIRSAGQNLADGVVSDPSQVRRYGALIEKEGRRLSNMVAQALEFAGIQSGRRAYRPQPADIQEILDGALDDCRWLLEEKRMEVEKDVPSGLPLVRADATALRRAVQNLLENAVKYGGRGGWIGIQARSEVPGTLEITVADRGPGIRREDLPRLFEPFYRGRDAAAGTIPGSGLGLSLVRHIAEAHGGRVTVAPGAAGQGSAFTLHLPAEAGA